MNDISPLNPLGPAGLPNDRPIARAIQPAAALGRAGDSVELSTTAQLLSRLSELPAIREELVASIRAQIAAGTYETGDKIDAVVDELLDELDA